MKIGIDGNGYFFPMACGEKKKEWYKYGWFHYLFSACLFKLPVHKTGFILSIGMVLDTNHGLG